MSERKSIPESTLNLQSRVNLESIARLNMRVNPLDQFEQRLARTNPGGDLFNLLIAVNS